MRIAAGVSDHAGWAVVMTVDASGALCDHRTVRLVDADLPSLPHHHPAQHLPLDEGIALIARVRASAVRHAAAALDAVEAAAGAKLDAIGLRKCPPMPATVAERIQDYRAQCVADTVMFREVLAEAAAARGCAVHWYEPKRVFDAACALPAGEVVAGYLTGGDKIEGVSRDKDHRMAMAAAIGALVV